MLKKIAKLIAGTYRDKKVITGVTTGVALIAGITGIQKLGEVDSAQSPIEADEVTLKPDDIETVSRSERALESFVGNTEDSDSVINAEDTEEEVVEVEEVEEVTVQEDEVEVVGTEVENTQNLAVESNQTVQTTPTNNNTTSSGNGSAPTQRVENSTSSNVDAERQAQQRAEREANERATAERAAQERAAQERAAQQEAEEAARREAEEAARKEASKLQANQLLVNGQAIGEYQGNRVWLINSALSGNVSYSNNAGIEQRVTIETHEVTQDYISITTGQSVSYYKGGNYAPIAIQQLANGNMKLFVLHTSF